MRGLSLASILSVIVNVVNGGVVRVCHDAAVVPAVAAVAAVCILCTSVHLSRAIFPWIQ